jgi:hypothetical protein
MEKRTVKAENPSVPEALLAHKKPSTLKRVMRRIGSLLKRLVGKGSS